MPDVAASRLASSRTHAIGVIVSSLTNGVFADYLRALHDTLLPAGFQVVVFSSRYSAEEEEKVIGTLIGQHPEAIIIAGIDQTPGVALPVEWVTIADRYPKMKPQEQQRLQKRLADWAKLTPAQRAAARDKYQALKKLPPKQRKEVLAQWQRYQQSLKQQPHFSPSDPPAPPDPQSVESATSIAGPAPSGAGRSRAPE